MRKLLVAAGLLGLLALFAFVPGGFASQPAPSTLNPPPEAGLHV
jgi:hypothetical protein